MPAARQRSASPFIAWAVRATIGTCRGVPRSRSRIAAVASKPSISGICTSISTRSNALAGERRERLAAVLDDDRPVAGAFQHAHGDALVDRVVLGDQHAQPAPGRTRGRCARPRAAGRRLERLEDAVEQVRLLDRLDQVRGDAERDRAPLVPGSRARGEHQQRACAASARRRRIRSASAKPSISGMFASSSTSGNGRPRAAALLELPRAPRGRRPRASGACASARASPRGCAGWWRCRPPPARAGRAMRAASGCARRLGRRRRRSAPRSGSGCPARRALDPEPAAHHRDQPRRDRQPEAGAAVLARGRAVGLGEGLEDQLLLLGRDADAGVAHRRRRASRQLGAAAASPRPRPAPRRASVNLMALPTRLTITCRSRAASPTTSGGTSGATRETSSSPFWCARTPSVRSVSPSSSRRSNGSRRELELARLDLREVEHVVDQAEQRLGRVLERASGTRAARCAAACRAAARPCRSRRSSACGSRGSCWPGSRSWRGWRPRPPRAPAAAPAPRASARSRRARRRRSSPSSTSGAAFHASQR